MHLAVMFEIESVAEFLLSQAKEKEEYLFSFKLQTAKLIIMAKYCSKSSQRICGCFKYSLPSCSQMQVLWWLALDEKP